MLKDFVSEEVVEKAVRELAESRDQWASAKVTFDSLKDHTKTILADESLNAQAKTGKEKEWMALRSEVYINHLAKLKNAQLDFLTIDVRRGNAERIIDLWKCVQANSRRGLL